MPTLLRQQAYPFGSLRKDPHWSVQGLVFYPNFRPAGKLIDESPFGNHGTIIRATWVGNALSFSGATTTGTEQYVQVGIWQGYPEFTVTAIVKFEQAIGTIEMIVSADSNNDALRAFQFRRNTGGYLEGIGFVSNAAKGTTGMSRQLTTGQWWHCAIVNDGTNLLVYVNGLLDGSIASGANDSDAAALAIAARAAALDYSNMLDELQGQISDVSIYNRALSASEIAELAINPNLPMQRDPIWLFSPPPVVGVTPKGPLGHPLYGPFAGPIAC